MSNEKNIELENLSKTDNKQNSGEEKTIDVGDKKEAGKKNKTKKKDLDTERSNLILLKMALYLFLIYCNVILIYIIKPVSVFLELMFLSDIIFIDASDESSSSSNQSTKYSTLRAIGMIIIFVLPIYNFLTRAIEIIVIQDNLASQIFAFFYTLIEIFFNIPLTFMYDSNLYSIFLYGEKGIKQTISPWLVFFPTNYTTSIFEIIRNFVEPFFFIGVGLAHLNIIVLNKYQSYRYIILLILMILCVVRIIGNVVYIIVRLVFNSDKTKTNKIN
jgi:hypothetical protein